MRWNALDPSAIVRAAATSGMPHTIVCATVTKSATSILEPILVTMLCLDVGVAIPAKNSEKSG